MNMLEDNYRQALESIERICNDCGRDASEVKLVCVSKTVGPDTVGEALASGMRVFGENRAQDFDVKQARFPDAEWHFIGRIQTNKLKLVVGRAALIHSVSSVHALQAIERLASRADIVQDVLFEVNASGEESKDGFSPDDLPSAFDAMVDCTHVRACGLMTMAPHGDSMRARESFGRLRALRATYGARYEGAANIVMKELSMGMSEDYGIALEEGATIIRLGRSIFGF